MRNRDYFLPSITTLVIFGLAWFLSCAHQNRMQDEADAGFEQTAEAPVENEKPQEEVATSEEAEKAPSTPGTEPTVAPQAESEQAQNEAQTEVPPVTNPEENNSAQNPEVTSNEVTPEVEPQLVEELAEAPKPQPVWLGVVPKIPSKAVKRKGKSLNRFYFARKGDTPKSVSELIYSDKKHAKLLAAWNGKAWQPGKILYYSSPMDPADKKMRSFYQERKVVPEEYTVSAGDWLTRIASKKLRSARSWKEIAVVNGLKQPNSLEVGQLLAIYPLDLLAAPAPRQEEVATNDAVSNLPMIEKPAPQPQEAKPQPLMPEQPLAEAQAPEMAPPPTQAPQAQVPQQEPAPVMDAEASQPEVPATNWDQVVEQNFVAILIGAAVVVLLLVLAARKKKQRAQASASGEAAQEEFTENTPSKFRKR